MHAIHHHEKVTRAHFDNLESTIRQNESEMAGKDAKIKKQNVTISELQAKIQQLEISKYCGKAGELHNGNETYQLAKNGWLAGMYTKRSTEYVGGQKYNEWKVLSLVPQVGIGPASGQKVMHSGIPFRQIVGGPNEGKLVEQFVENMQTLVINGDFFVVTRVREKANGGWGGLV